MNYRKAYRIFRNCLKPIHKYGVPFLFLFTCFNTFIASTDWYFNNFADIEYNTTMGILPCLIMFSSGFVHGKCTWFKWSSFGLLSESTFNYIDFHYEIPIYIDTFRFIVLVISLIAVLYYFHFEFKGCKYESK